MKIVSLGDICDRIDYGLTASAAETGGPKFLRITDIERNHIDWEVVPRCVANDVETSKYALATGDVVVARTGASTGRSQWVQVDQPAVFASYLVRFRAGPSVDSRFLGYVLDSQPWKQFVASVAHGKSAQPNMSASAMAEFAFPLPNSRVQHAITAVLGALDDKISSNERVAAKADELREAWVNVSASAGGERPLSELARFVNGRPFTRDATGFGRVVIRIAELNSGLGASTVFNDIDVADEHVARPGDLLFAWSGSLTVVRWYRDEAIVNQHIFKVIPNDGYPGWLVDHALKAKLDEFKSVAADKATTMGHIQRRHLDEPVRVPSAEDVRRLDEPMTALWKRALTAELESLQLERTRGELLPLLLSGRLAVEDAEKVVEEVL